MNSVINPLLQFSTYCGCFSVAKSCLILCDIMDCSMPGPCPLLFPSVYSHACPLSSWCYLIISSSATPFSFYLQSFPAPGSFPISHQLFTWPKYWSFSFSCTYNWLPFFLNLHGSQMLSVQFSPQSMSDSMWPHGLKHTRFPCHHQILELTQTLVHRVSDATQPSHPLLPISHLLSIFPSKKVF